MYFVLPFLFVVLVFIYLKRNILKHVLTMQVCFDIEKLDLACAHMSVVCVYDIRKFPFDFFFQILNIYAFIWTIAH